MTQQENIVYVSAHDNQTLFDVIQAKAPADATIHDRVRMNNLALSVVMFSQGVPFFHAGDDILRSKSFNPNSYNSGDWFNKLDHYDHLGIGKDGNSLDANPLGKIHNGADDNASGVAGVLALANLFQHNKMKEHNNFLFICFSGEELGLYGSKKFCENPSIDLTRVNFMINMDMIGRLDSLNRLLVYGVGTAAPFVKLVEAKNSIFKLKLDSSGIGPSDHTSFYLKDIPVLHFFTGQPADYNKSSDDIEKINFKGIQKVLEYIAVLIEELDKGSKLTFLKTRNADIENTPKFKVT